MASIALGYVLGYINFHIGPQEILLQILVHLSTVEVNRELGHMSLIEDGLPNFWVNGNHKTSSKLDHILVILLETCILRISLC
jgi:hypothetical protein